MADLIEKITDDEGFVRETLSRKYAKSFGLEMYFTGKPCKNGHVMQRRTVCGGCLSCKREQVRKWRKSNPDYVIKNKDKIREAGAKYYQENKEFIKERSRLYRIHNKDAINDHRRSWHKKKYREGSYYKTNKVCRDILRRILSTLGAQKQGKTADILGYNGDDLKGVIDRRLLPGMSWENHGSVWQLDHKYPVSRYVKEGVTDPAIINSLDNLIPMYVEHNLDKSDSTLQEFLEDNPHLESLYKQFV